MKISEEKVLSYKMILTEDEIDSLIRCLSNAKADWNADDITLEILTKLKKLREI